MPEEWPSERDSVYRRPPMMYPPQYEEPTYYDNWREMPLHDWADDSYLSFGGSSYSSPPTHSHGDGKLPPTTPIPTTPKQTAMPTATATPVTKYHCDVCNIYMTDQNQLDSHCRGFKHIKMCNRQQKKPINSADAVVMIQCKVCGKHMTRQKLNVDIHKDTGRHLKWVETYKRRHRGKEPNEDGMFVDVVMANSEVEEVMRLEQNPEGYTCDLCDLTLLTYDIYQKHVLGQKHQKLLFKQNTNDGENVLHHCEICDVRMIGGERAFKAHLDGQKHRKKLGIKAPLTASVAIKDPPTPSVAIETTKEVKAKGEFYCEVCEIKCNSSSTFDNHINGKQHKRKTNKQD